MAAIEKTSFDKIKTISTERRTLVEPPGRCFERDWINNGVGRR